LVGKSWGGYDVFVKWDKTIIDSTDANKENVVKLRYGYYYYKFTSEQQTKFANFLVNEKEYWLASPYVYCTDRHATFDVRIKSYSSINGFTVFSAHGTPNSMTYGVRAVVSI